ncbi:glycosyltransferase [Pseudomonas monteilii]
MFKAASNRPKSGLPYSTDTTVHGAILGLYGDVLQGWALDSAYIDRRLAVEIFIDGASVALTRADQFEPEAPMGDQFHGFAVQLKKNWLSDAKSITAQIANESIALEGQIEIPAPISQQPSTVTAQVWHSGGLRISGWAWDPAAPMRHVQIKVQEGTSLIAQVSCNEHHQALAYRKSTDHGFTIDLPWELADGNLHLLDVISDLGQTLPGSPIRLCCRPEGLEGLLRQMDVLKGDPTFSLLEKVAKEQALRLPKSAGWQSYPEWFEAFQKLDDTPPLPLLGTIGIVLVSNGDKTSEQISLASFGGSETIVKKIVITSADEVSSALLQLLDVGCDRILPIMAGDRLASNALCYLSALLNKGSAWGYADCDRDDAQSKRSFPWLKPSWDIELFIGADIFTPGAIFGASIVKQALAVVPRRDGLMTCNWYQLTAAIALLTERDELHVVHLPKILYHRASNTPPSPEQCVPSVQRKQAIEWLCEQLVPGATISVVENYPALLRVHWPLPKILPRVSLIVPTRDQYKLLSTCIEGLLNNTDYPNLELIVVDNDSTEEKTIRYLEEIAKRGVIVIRHPFPFNYSTINNRAASIASGELIGLINNDIEIIHNGWLKEMVAQLAHPDTGAVGAKLLWPNDMVQHAGVVVGINGLAAHTGNNWHAEDAGYLGFNQISRRMSAVTAACLLTKAEVYRSLGGLDETFFPVAFNDVDYCMRVTKLGLKIIWNAHAKLIHAESASRGKDITNEKKARAAREQENFMERWTLHDWTDPYYHVGLSADYLSTPYGALALPPRKIP